MAMGTKPSMVRNWGREMRFLLDGEMELTRRLVSHVQDPEYEINIESPVGQVLGQALVGEEVIAKAPSGDVIVKVLEIF